MNARPSEQYLNFFNVQCQKYKNMNKINSIYMLCVLFVSKSCQKLDRIKIGHNRRAQ